jgi:hypothetical protein
VNFKAVIKETYQVILGDLVADPKGAHLVYHCSRMLVLILTPILLTLSLHLRLGLKNGFFSASFETAVYVSYFLY